MTSHHDWKLKLPKSTSPTILISTIHLTTYILHSVRGRENLNIFIPCLSRHVNKILSLLTARDIICDRFRNYSRSFPAWAPFVIFGILSYSFKVSHLSLISKNSDPYVRPRAHLEWTKKVSLSLLHLHLQ